MAAATHREHRQEACKYGWHAGKDGMGKHPFASAGMAEQTKGRSYMAQHGLSRHGTAPPGNIERAAKKKKATSTHPPRTPSSFGAHLPQSIVPEHCAKAA